MMCKTGPQNVDLFYNHEKIKVVSQFTYLGVTLSCIRIIIILYRLCYVKYKTCKKIPPPPKKKKKPPPPKKKKKTFVLCL